MSKNRSVLGRWLRALGVTLVIAGAAVGCADGDRLDAQLDIAAPDPAEQLAEEEAWLRKQQQLRLTQVGADGTILSQDPTNIGVLNFPITSHCQTSTPYTGATGSSCGYVLGSALIDLCTSRTYLALASAQADPVSIPGPPGTTYLVDQVGDETSAALATEATVYAGQALDRVLAELKSPGTGCRNGTLWTRISGESAALHLGRIAGDAYYLGLKAFDRAIETTLNASDKLRGSSVSPKLAAQRALSGSLLSRAAAAHLLVGGNAGVDGDTLRPLCTSPDLSPQQRSAVKLLRDAGVSPGMLTLTNLDDLLNGTLQDGSVRQRLGQYYGIGELSSGAAVATYYDITNDDFDAAARYLREEVSAFSRSSRATLPVSTTGWYPRYAGVANEPAPLPKGAWAARVSYRTTEPNWAVTIGGVTRPAVNASDLRQFIATSHIGFQNILRSTDNFAGSGESPATIRGELFGILGTIISGREHLGTIRLRYEADKDLDVVAFNFTKEDRLRVVVGEDGLRCAVEGSIEGADCSDVVPTVYFPCAATAKPSFSCLTAARLTESTATTSVGGQQTYGGKVNAKGSQRLEAYGFNISDFIASKTRLYVVRPKTPTSPELPGQYELLVGMNLHTADAYHYLPVVPSVDARVDPVFAPSRKFCSIPETSCAGVTMDARLPLEDELTEDHDGVENSWKHYLALARQAANETDLYGQEFVNNSLAHLSGQTELETRTEEQQQQAESILRELQDICGTAIDSTTLLTGLSGTVPSDLSQMYVANPTGAPCATGYTAVPDGCLFDFKQILSKLPDTPDIRRLAECLSVAVTPFVTLGSKTLCVYSLLSDPNNVCPPGIDCPVPKPDGGSCPAPLQDHKLDETVNLNYYEDTSPAAGPCTTFRRVRTNPRANDQDRNRATEDLKAIQAANYFIPARLRESIQSIEWNAKYGGFSDVVVNGAIRYSTGHASTGPKVDGICAPRPDCSPDTAKGLFCHPASCNDPATRGPFNYRLMRATFAANLALGLADEGSVKSTFPDYARFPDVYNGTGPGNTLLALDPCTAQGAASASTSPNWVYLWNDGSWITYHSGAVNQDLMDQQLVRIKECRATASSGDTYPLPRAAGYAAYERLSDIPGIAWIGPDGSSYFSKNGERFAFKAGYGRALTAYDADAVSNSLLGGLTMQEGGGPHWTLPVLRGERSENELNAGALSNYHAFAPYYPVDNLRQDYVMDYSGWNLTGSDLLDGVELLCELGRQSPTVTVSQQAMLESIDSAAIALEQLANSVIRAGASTIFPRVPTIAQDAMRLTSPVGAVPLLGGRMAQEVSGLREALIATRHSLPVVSGALRQLSLEIRSYRSQVEIAFNQNVLLDLSALSQKLTALQSCAQDVTGISPLRPLSVIGAAASCAYTGVQLGIAMQSAELQKEINDTQLELARQGMLSRISQLATNLETSSIAMRESFERVDRSLAAIEGLQKQSRITLARALYTASYQSNRQLAYVHALGTIATTYQERYTRSLKNAKLMAFFAKRAVEQRLGVRLNEMIDPLPLVEAPATWEGGLCTYSGVPYRSSTQDYRPYIGGFIGEYVSKLENVVESYRLQYKFHEGEDVAIVSLRDDVMGIKAPCKATGRNLLANANQLHAGPWTPIGCQAVSIGGTDNHAYNCMAAVPLGEQSLDGLIHPVSAANGYRLRAGTGSDSCPITSCGYQAGAALAQRVALSPGRYRFSWYTKETGLNGGSDYNLAQVKALPGATEMIFEGASIAYPVGSSSWSRIYSNFEIPDNANDGRPGEYDVGFGWSGSLSKTVTIAAPMLERLPNDGTSVILGSFQSTDAAGRIQLSACEDTNGENFRARAWRRECVHLCDSGFSNNCTDGPEHCYQELSFGISQRWIESGKLFSYSGFARGNFNYRIDSLALNFVGSAVRNCEASDAPSTCYSAGFVPYSIEHDGPFFVSTHDGRDFRAYLFDGRIEHARGLAAERYLTNPLSSTDRDLLTDYMRSELQGRPLDGNFTIRVWDEPGVDFNAIEDIQLVLKYKYWTRFE